MPQEYLLFVDTETTGLPRGWDQPYTKEPNWPYIAQLGWAVYTVGGEQVKADQDYLLVPAGSMPASAIAIHGLTPAFLQEHGQPPHVVLQRLLSDLETYQPRVIGHFLQLDFHVLGAAFERAGLPNPLLALPQFCTMTATKPSLPNAPHERHLRLHELHELLFDEALERPHDAYVDALATARCFFELQRRGWLTDDILLGQLPLTAPVAPVRKLGWLWVLGVVGAGLLCILYWILYG
ncbi:MULTISPECIES: 3'-5' exonuclease [Hymenobacter]|uniref:DNA polymerase-3 subunit epsilon n=1 Tax=Hymenobacter mucosus TaxID=1411120 RepID=A0A238ZSI3_9BACT|nr:MULTISPECIES: 3'-5' exonuclease [Hymenobacter]SNR86275.1 DNA polymerase-3 subunit epsilon [Hymenobacter mucosus]